MTRRAGRAIAHWAERARAAWPAGPLSLLITGLALFWSVAAAAPAAGTSAVKPAAPVRLRPSAPLAGTASAGNPAVGALFTTGDGRLGTHFCTASVVDSPAGDLLVTAAHCVAGYSDADPADLAFAPGYANGRVPYGIWTVTRIFVDSAWAASADPDDDVAFLQVALHAGNTSVEDVTGSERLPVSRPSTGVVRVIGYPQTRNQPISCQNRISVFASGQLEFDCANFTNGTSGAPFLTDVDSATGDGTVIGVIGGYQQGGSSSDVSYAATFRRNVVSLFGTAVRGSGRVARPR